MPVAINMPQRQTPVAMDPLEKLATAVNIARQGYGIYADTQALERAKQQREEQSAAAEAAQQQAENEQNGILTPKERVGLLAHAVEATKPNAPGAFIIRSSQPDSDEPLTEWVRSKKGEIDPLKAQMAQDRADAAHDKYVQHIEDSEKSWRSDPASTRFDAQLAAAQSGKALIDRYRGHEDDMPIQDVHALVSDRLKAISGATPTEKEIEAQMPSSRRGSVAHPIDALFGRQHPAESGDFVRNIDQSFQEMENTAMAGLQHRQETVANSPKLTADERARLVTIGVPARAYSQGAPALANQGGGAGQYTADVLQYAKQHNITPDQANNVKLQRTSNIGAR